SNHFSFVLNQKGTIEPEHCLEALSSHFHNHSPLQGQTAAIQTAGMLLLHLKETLNLKLEQITSIQSKTLYECMAIDRTTERHLEMTEPLTEKGMTLLSFLDETVTPMGGRLLVSWLKRPLLSVPEIEKRQNAVALFLERGGEKLRESLQEVRDLERLITKILARMATPRDVLALGRSLSFLPAIQEALKGMQGEIAEEIHSLFDATFLSQKIVNALNDSPPLRMGDGDIFKEGHDAQLDRLRKLAKDSISWMIEYQNRLREETGIKTLKVGYTKAFGYYIEVSRAQSEKVPLTFQRRQTLVNGERFLTEELKQFEYQVLTAEERAKAIEAELFEKLREEIAKEGPKILHASRTIARLDVFLAFAKIAKEKNLVRPLIDTSDLLEIIEGRHPIVETAIGKNSFIPNDTSLDTKCQMMLITGPNMAGKSTYIRQVALIIILAQIGSYVPAKKAHIGLIDKVFSRIGASDDLSRGQSTFMVEMSETAHILRNVTSRSFVILDEIGRGTSTYDGISIAAAVAEFLLTTPNQQPKTLFATHYWELTRLEKEYPNLKNFQTAVQELPSGIVFLRKIIEGGTDKSYGIHVAKLAGLPLKVIRSAENRLKDLETVRPKKKKDEQLPLFSTEHPIVTDLKTLDCDQMTPLQALQKLIEWKNAL
ncbi:MAG: DNA mismatch repair protein MutS, partial [Chlamydiae bacterium]|nr:DNA mismatch repair protein MutS [Chlamydiota bacterium]